MKRLLAVSAVFVMFLLLCGFSYAAENEVAVTGKLIRTFAIGGETTGWAVKLDSPLQVGDETLDRIEIDIGDRKINIAAFENKIVKVTGNLVKRTGVERGAYWVIMVKEFSWSLLVGAYYAETHSVGPQVVEERVKTCPNAGCNCTMVDDGKGHYYCPCCGYQNF